MTTLTLPMPRLGETMDEGTIAEWLVKPGDSFKRGDPLLEVETDKTLVEYPALGDGTLRETLVHSGDVVEVGAPIAVIETEDTWDGIGAAEPAPQPQPDPQHTPQPVPVAQTPSATAATAAPRATPLARRIAKAAGVSLEQISGTGRRGRIEADDVRALTASSGIAAQSHAKAYLVHGFAGLGSNWAALRASLQRGGVQAEAPDLPGHGRNSEDAADVEALVTWLAYDLDQQADPVHLIAHSLGAYVAAKAVLRAPRKVARLTLIAPAGCGAQINGSFLQGMAQGPNVGALTHLMRMLGPKACAFDAQTLDVMAQELGAGRLTALAADAARGDVQRIDTIAVLQALAGTLPITAIFGLHDQIIPRDHAFHLPPDVACHMVGTGHMPHWDAVDTVARIITAP